MTRERGRREEGEEEVEEEEEEEEFTGAYAADGGEDGTCCSAE